MEDITALFLYYRLQKMVKRWSKVLKINHKLVVAHIVNQQEMALYDDSRSSQNRTNISGYATAARCLNGNLPKRKRMAVILVDGNYLTNNNVVHELLHYKNPKWSEFRVRKNAAKICGEKFDGVEEKKTVKELYD